MTLRLVLSPSARADQSAIAEWTIEHFGENAALRYQALIEQTIADLAADPDRPGTVSRPELYRDARTYHIYFSRDRVAHDRVHKPRHLILFRVNAGELQVARILHDSCELKRHVPSGL